MIQNESTETIRCPICEDNNTDYIVVDVYSCNTCAHIFKHPQTDNGDVAYKNIHLLKDPVNYIRNYTSHYDHLQDIEFVIPSMVFFDIDLYPSSFYKHEYNHYFSQISLMIFLRRCGLMPIAQINTWSGNIAKTRIKCIKDRRI